MIQETAQSSSRSDKQVGLTILGVLFTIGWIVACVVFALFALMGDVMSIGPGETNADFAAFLIIQLVALVIAAIAGIQGGRAFYRTGHRERLLRLFATLLLASVLIFFSSFPLAGIFSLLAR